MEFCTQNESCGAWHPTHFVNTFTKCTALSFGSMSVSFCAARQDVLQPVPPSYPDDGLYLRMSDGLFWNWLSRAPFSSMLSFGVAFEMSFCVVHCFYWTCSSRLNTHFALKPPPPNLRNHASFRKVLLIGIVLTGTVTLDFHKLTLLLQTLTWIQPAFFISLVICQWTTVVDLLISQEGLSLTDVSVFRASTPPWFELQHSEAAYANRKETSPASLPRAFLRRALPRSCSSPRSRSDYQRWSGATAGFSQNLHSCFTAGSESCCEGWSEEKALIWLTGVSFSCYFPFTDLSAWPCQL